MVRDRKKQLKLNVKRSKYGRYMLPLKSYSKGYMIDMCVIDELVDRDIKIVKYIDYKCEHIVACSELIKMSLNKDRM